MVLCIYEWMHTSVPVGEIQKHGGCLLTDPCSKLEEELVMMGDYSVIK